MMHSNKIISSLIWKFLERSGTQVVQFVIQIILARLLLPEDYGTIALVTIFITIANVFVQSGFNTALIQKKEIDDCDLSSVFYLSLFVAFFIYLLLFFCSPFIAAFYKQPILVPVFRILAITLLFGAINSIQQAVVARNLEFKKYFFTSLFGIFISAIVGVVLAYKGFGVWALVAQQLVNIILVTLTLFFVIKWHPRLLFSFKRLKELFSYGWKILCSGLIDTIYRNIYDLVIGKKYSSAALAYYNRGKQFPTVIIQNVDSSINSVMLPVLSKEQDNKDKIKRIMRRSIVTSSFLIFPISVGLIAVAKPMVNVVLTSKWLECVPFLQLLSISYAFWPIHTANLQAINSIGRSDIFLKLEIIKKVLGVLVLIITLPMGLIPMAIGQVITSVISTFINSYPNRKLLNYKYIEQVKDILPSFLISIVMGIITYSVIFIGLSDILTLIIQLILGILVYVVLAYAFKLECFNYLIMVLKNIINKKTG